MPGYGWEVLVTGSPLRTVSGQCATLRRSRRACSGDDNCMNRGDPALGLMGLSVAVPRTEGCGVVYEAH